MVMSPAPVCRCPYDDVSTPRKRKENFLSFAEEGSGMESTDRHINYKSKDIVVLIVSSVDIVSLCFSIVFLFILCTVGGSGAELYV